MQEEDHNKDHCYSEVWNEFYCVLLLNAPLLYIVREAITIIGKGYRSKVWIIMEIIICCTVLILCSWFDLFDLISQRMIWVIGMAFNTVIMFEMLYFMMTSSQIDRFRTLLSTKTMITTLVISTIFHLFINSWSYHSFLQSIEYSMPMMYIIIEPYVFVDKVAGSNNIDVSSDSDCNVSIV